ncbi:hypothetical protein HNR46_002396 [Haloferula luteola]|uniref:Uncharacterized protein n=1 Tax=Haloferula luteola TaxID=595692 RepID=A0A840V3Q5_9BACT|nr:DUF6515 family protein [Haloferula luteola]MBB5352153.1 hypothetical protein [Haloferula luteola]
MKLQNLVISAAALTAALSLSSCVDPYYAGPASVTTYQPGYVVNTLPSGYSTVSVSGTTYYRHNDVYYRPRGNRYVVVERPGGQYIGPHGDRDRDGRPNWRDQRDNRYDRRDGRYDRDSHAHFVQTLPSGYRVVTHRGTRYYVAGNTYYQPQNNGYVIVANPF